MQPVQAFYKRMLYIANSYDLSAYHELAIAFEYAWHMIFGEPPVIVPTPECQLLTCTPEQQASDQLGRFIVVHVPCVHM